MKFRQVLSKGDEFKYIHPYTNQVGVKFTPNFLIVSMTVDIFNVLTHHDCVDGYHIYITDWSECDSKTKILVAYKAKVFEAVYCKSLVLWTEVRSDFSFFYFWNPQRYNKVLYM